MRISNEYRKLNTELHTNSPDYGVSVRTLEVAMEPVSNLIAVTKAKTILDYGCGKGKFIEALSRKWPEVEVRGYDPAIEKFSEEPSNCDVVISFDVLEHVEPECISQVIEHIANLTGIAAMLNVATKPAKKILADGRNAHLIVEPHSYWRELLDQHMKIVIEEEQANSSLFVLQHHRT